MATIQKLCESCPTSALQPKSFFVAWQGVIVLAFEGFSEPLVKLKESINTEFTALRNENHGSKWPKITLGSLNDQVELTMTELHTLRQICDTYLTKLAPSLPSDGKDAKELKQSQYLFQVNQASVVLFANRSLTRLISRTDFDFDQKKDETEISQDQKDIVNSILSEFVVDQDYLSKINRPGGRWSHYNDPHVESTLVSFLFEEEDADSVSNEEEGGGGLALLLEQFRKSVDHALPGRYAWIDNTSLHMTIRALI